MVSLVPGAPRRIVGVLLTLIFFAIHVVWVPFHLADNDHAGPPQAGRARLTDHWQSGTQSAPTSRADAPGEISSVSLHCHRSLGHQDDPDRPHPSVDHGQDIAHERASVRVASLLAVLTPPVRVPECLGTRISVDPRVGPSPDAGSAFGKTARGPPRT